MKAPLVKACGCGRLYTRAQWDALAYVGPWDDETELFELRNCACGSTLALSLGASPKLGEGKTEPVPA